MTNVRSGPPKPIPGSAKKGRTELQIKTWVARQATRHQKRIVDFLLRAYGGVLIATILIILLQGFKVWGFSLEPSFLNWLGGATIGELAGLLALAVGAVFPRHKSE